MINSNSDNMRLLITGACMSVGIIILIVIVIVIAIWLVSAYNRLVRQRNEVKNAWSQIDVQLQRRYDLIPNLVESVKSYMSYERGTLEAVIQARNTAQTAKTAL